MQHSYSSMYSLCLKYTSTTITYITLTYVEIYRYKTNTRINSRHTFKSLTQTIHEKASILSEKVNDMIREETSIQQRRDDKRRDEYRTEKRR